MLSPFARRLVPCVLLLSLPATSRAEAEVPLAGPTIRFAEAVSQALEKNPDLAVFGYAFRAHDGQALQAGLAPNPNLNLSIEDALGSGRRKGFKTAEQTLSLSQVLERGARERRIAAAEAGRELLDAEHLEKWVDTAAETARRYGHVLSDQVQLEVTHEASELARNTVDAARKRVKAGAAPSAEVARAQAALARADLEHEHAEHELLSSRRQLAALWGDREPAFGVAEGDLLTLPTLAPFDALAARLQANPGLLKFIAEQRLRDAEVRLAEQARKPAWQITAGVRRFGEGKDVAGVLALQIPLAFRDRGQGAIAEAQARSEQVAVKRTAAEITGLTQLFEWFQELKHAHTAANTLATEIVPRMEDALRQTEYAYARGRYGYQELVAAQKELLDARRARIQAAADAWQFATEIDRLTGVLPTGDRP
ncbi:TolC family protein [Nevskia sp.]|uniref:TolC family protein n=1 Tax=Nevskia sp. TaxID=1929292 RepID=UPI0025F8B38F|nr:TolC family protein [Nevskia sp.]